MKTVKTFLGVAVFFCGLLAAATASGSVTIVENSPPLGSPVGVFMGNLRLSQAAYYVAVGSAFQYTVTLDFSASGGYWDYVGSLEFGLDFGDSTFEVFNTPKIAGDGTQTFIQAAGSVSHSYGSAGTFAVTPFLLGYDAQASNATSVAWLYGPGQVTRVGQTPTSYLEPSAISYATVFAVPEANTWTMFILGILLVVFSMVRARGFRKDGQ